MAIPVDLSGSMWKHVRELKTVLSEFLKDSNMEGKVQIPKPEGSTAMVQALHDLAPQLEDCDVTVITDGLENCIDTPISVTSPSGEVVTFDFAKAAKEGKKSPAYLQLVASYLRSVCGAQLYFVGLGADAKKMSEIMIKKPNCVVSWVDRGATPEALIGVVRTMRNRGAAQRALLLEQRVPQAEQEGLIVELSPEVQTLIATLDAADVNRVVASGEAITVSDTSILALPPPPPPPLTADEVKAKIEAAEAAVAIKLPMPDKPKLRAALLVALAAMAQGALPGALFGGRHASILHDGEALGPLLNRMFFQLVLQKLLKNEGNVPDEGILLRFEGKHHKIAKRSTLYRCLAPVEALDALAADAAWAAPRSGVKRKRE